jgi:NADH:ubiquinone oxidoreductase subunit 2 (subunit N)
MLGIGFLDRFVWLREAPNTSVILLTVGILMIVTGGIWAAVERHLARMMAFALILDIGFSLLALGLAGGVGSDLYRGLFFAGLIPRGLSLGVWALALSSLIGRVEGLDLGGIRGIGRRFPVISISIVLAIFCLAGVPLLASFSMRLGVIEGLSVTAPQYAIWAIIGSLGLLMGGIRTLISIVSGTDDTGWELNESRMLAIYLSIGVIALLILGIFPNLFFNL